LVNGWLWRLINRNKAGSHHREETETWETASSSFSLICRSERKSKRSRAARGSAPIYRNLATNGLIRKDNLNGENGTGA